MNASIDGLAGEKIPGASAAEVALSFPHYSLHYYIYSELNGNGRNGNGAQRAPELLRRARTEILEHNLKLPLVPKAYAAYAYLMLHFPNVPAEERARHVNEIFARRVV